MHYKRWFVLPVLYSFCALHAENIGLLGGQQNFNQGYASFVSSTGDLTSFSTGFIINSVAINGFAQGLLGGQDLVGNPSVIFISPTGALTSLNVGTNGSTQSVALNDAGEGLIGGISNAMALAAFVSSTGNVTPLTLGFNGTIGSVAINSSSQGFIGGINGIAPYAAKASSAQATPLNLGFTTGIINAVAINSSSQGLLGGQDFSTGSPYAAFVTPSSQVIPYNLSIPMGYIQSVALNNSSLGLLGGQNGSAAYAAQTTETSVAPLTLGIANGQINSVAINAFNQGLIGGRNNFTLAPYAALISPSGQVSKLTLGISNGTINSVAINDYSQGLIGGQINLPAGPPYAALISPSGQVIPLNLGIASGKILSVALLSQIPVDNLSGNNLDFANYINQNAPYNAFYFVPDYFAGTLEEALASAAPTRSITSLFTADNNLFFLDTLLSNHCRNARHIRRQIRSQKAEALAHRAIRSDTLLVSIDETLPLSTQPDESALSPKRQHEKPYEVWGAPFGALAYQKKQHQTPGFSPSTGGIILGFDGKVETHTRLGTGAAYTYTYIHQKEDAGHSRINQEYLLFYTSWDNRRFYFDTALWLGLFQIENVRKIHLTAFEFRTKAHPKGWQVSPHLEFGYDFNSNKLTTEPFVMFDWINNWQKAHKEHGSGPFNAGHKRHYSSFLRSETGVRVYETFRFDRWNFVIQEKVSYVNKKPFNVGRIKAFLIGSPGTFTVETLTTTQNLGVAELEFIFQPHNLHYPRATLEYQGEFGSMYQSHLASLELTWKF